MGSFHIKQRITVCTCASFVELLFCNELFRPTVQESAITGLPFSIFPQRSWRRNEYIMAAAALEDLTVPDSHNHLFYPFLTQDCPRRWEFCEEFSSEETLLFLQCIELKKNIYMHKAVQTAKSI